MSASISSSSIISQGIHFPQPMVDNHAVSTKKSNNDDSSSQTILKSASAKSVQKASTGLSKKDQAQIQQLKSRDAEVKTHEQAHLSAAGSLATSGASFTYATGPDGIRYAIGGEVSIDTSKVKGDPAATIKKAEIIQSAALAPASPSGQDKAVAAQARAMAEAARAELAQKSQQPDKIGKEQATDKTNLAKESKTEHHQPVDKIQTQNQSAAVKPKPGSVVNIFI